MAFWPFPSGPGRLVDMALTSQRPTSTAVVAHATPHEVGAWTETDAATASEWMGFSLDVVTTATSGTDTSTLLDVAIGAGGAEAPILSGVQIGFSQIPIGGVPGRFMFIPLRVPAGSRVSARARSAVSSRSSDIRVHGYAALTPASGPAGGAGCSTTYGAVTASSSGTAFTCGNGTLGAWAQVSAATTQRADAVLVTIGGSSGMSGLDVTVHVGVGAAGSEVEVATFQFLSTTGESIYPGTALIPARVNVPEGSRLAVAGSGSSGTIAFTANVHTFTR